jgi:hypothetical protein
MTRKEFSSKFDEYMRAGRWQGLLIPCALVVFLIVFVLTPNFLRDRMGIEVPDSVSAIILLLILVGFTIGLLFLGRSRLRRFGLLCPACGRNLADVEARRKVLLTGNCPKCQNKVLDEVAGSATCHGLNREKFKEQFESLTRNYDRKVTRLLISMFAVTIASVPMLKYFMRSVDSGALDWVTVTQWGWFAGLALAAVFLLAVLIVACAAGGKLTLRPMPCPGCGRSLAGIAGKFAVESGLCIYCGCQLFEAPPSEKASSDLRD